MSRSQTQRTGKCPKRGFGRRYSVTSVLCTVQIRSGTAQKISALQLGRAGGRVGYPPERLLPNNIPLPSLISNGSGFWRSYLSRGPRCSRCCMCATAGAPPYLKRASAKSCGAPPRPKSPRWVPHLSSSPRDLIPRKIRPTQLLWTIGLTLGMCRRSMLTPFMVLIGAEDRHTVSEGEFFGVPQLGRASTECDAEPKGAIPFYAFCTLSRGRSPFSLRERWCQKINVLLYICEQAIIEVVLACLASSPTPMGYSRPAGVTSAPIQDRFRFLGRLMAKAFMDSYVMPLPLSPAGAR